MTDNEIIKALECCNSHGIDACIECPYCDKYPNCIGDRNDDCIDLIERQKAEIEQWKEEANKYQRLWANGKEKCRMYLERMSKNDIRGS